MNLKLITIDFWNTLFATDSSPFRNSARLKVLMQTLTELDIHIQNAQFDAALTSAGRYYNDKWINEMRTPDAREVLTFVWNEMQFKPNPKALDYVIDFFENSILYFPPQLEPGAKSALEALSAKYKLGIVSDTGFSPGAKMTEMMANIGIAHYFAGFSYSDQTGVAKPHPKAFNSLLNELNVAPENALHIGDIEQTDIAGAKGVGMKAIRYDGNAGTPIIQQKNDKTQADIVVKSWDEIVELAKGDFCLTIKN